MQIIKGAILEQFFCFFSLLWTGNHVSEWSGGSERHWMKTMGFFDLFCIQKNYFRDTLILIFQELHNGVCWELVISMESSLWKQP